MYNKILVPLDGSKLSECSLDHVKSIATGCHVSEVVLMTVTEPVYTPMFWTASRTQAEEMGAELQQAREKNRQNAEDYLSQASEILKQAGVSARTAVVDGTETAKAAENILDYAQNNNIDLIIMSTHGRSGVTRWAMGSVADKVVRNSIIPVLTVTPKGCKVAAS
jgi:nucleotide-binding universal stress UspA family protein